MIIYAIWPQLYITSMPLNDTYHHFVGRQTVWISDGHHSMHVVDISSAVNETDKRESEETANMDLKFYKSSDFINLIFCHIYILRLENTFIFSSMILIPLWCCPQNFYSCLWMFKDFKNSIHQSLYYSFFLYIIVMFPCVLSSLLF